MYVISASVLRRWRVSRAIPGPTPITTDPSNAEQVRGLLTILEVALRWSATRTGTSENQAGSVASLRQACGASSAGSLRLAMSVSRSALRFQRQNIRSTCTDAWLTQTCRCNLRGCVALASIRSALPKIPKQLRLLQHWIRSSSPRFPQAEQSARSPTHWTCSKTSAT